MKVVNWNVQWATPASVRSPYILNRIADQSPDIVCLTETDLRLLDTWSGHLVSAKPEPGKSAANYQRKVVIWSRFPWKCVDDLGSEDLPPGRFVAGTADTPVGQIRVIGVCIPWHNANVNVGAKDKVSWAEHSTYLQGLASILKRKTSYPVVLTGDFNQQIGQVNRPYPPLSNPVRAGLQKAMLAGPTPGLTIATAGLGLRGRRSIDHIAISSDLSAGSLATIDNMDGERRLSDHFGVVADLSTRDAPQNPPQKSECYDKQQSSLELAPHHRA